MPAVQVLVPAPGGHVNTTAEDVADIPKVGDLLGVSAAAAWRMAAMPGFPAPVRLLPGGGRVWRTEDVREWADEHHYRT